MLTTNLTPNPGGGLELAPASPLLFVVSGPSGVGKDALLVELRERHPEYHYVVTVTTRAPRAGEVDGVHYHFRSKQVFEEMRDAGEFLEWAEVYGGNYYGSPKFELRQARDEGKDVVVKVDVQGARSIRALVPEAVLLFIAPSSLAELDARLAGRRTETPEQLAVRLATAREEMDDRHWFDYVLVNRDNELDRTVDDAVAILRAEKLRVKPRVFWVK